MIVSIKHLSPTAIVDGASVKSKPHFPPILTNTKTWPVSWHNVFLEEKQIEFSSITPNQKTRISQKTSSNAYNFTSKYDIDVSELLDNQKRPITSLFLTIINKGYSGYFNQPFNNVGLKQGWQFNITRQPNAYWNLTNINSNTNIPVSSYTKSNYTFYYNQDLKAGDVIDGDFCEWNDYEQRERVVSSYYQKIKYNQNVKQRCERE